MAYQRQKWFTCYMCNVKAINCHQLYTHSFCQETQHVVCIKSAYLSIWEDGWGCTVMPKFHRMGSPSQNTSSSSSLTGRLSPTAANNKQTNNENRETYQLGYPAWFSSKFSKLTNIIRIVWQTLRRITNEILGFKGLIVPPLYKKARPQQRQLHPLFFARSGWFSDVPLLNQYGERFRRRGVWSIVLIRED